MATQVSADCANPGIDVLIIDDNPDNVVLLEMILGRQHGGLGVGLALTGALQS